MSYVHPDSFLSPKDTPYEPAPAPPPGPALLDDNESNMLDNFFTTMNSNNLTNDFWLRDQQNNNKSIEPYNFQWSDELPPTFEGSTTSLSQPAFPHNNLEKHKVGMGSNNENTSSDILAAASMLYQNGLHGAGFDSVFGHQQQFPGHALSDMNGGNFGFNPHSKHPLAGLHTASKQPNESARARLPTGFHTSEMLFDTHKPIPDERQASAKVRTLHWGSDISFMDQGYIAPPEQPNMEEQTKDLLNNLECLEPQSSTANTRAPSPEHAAGGHDTRETGPGTGGPSGSRSGYQDMMEEDTQPKKKQRTLIKEEDDNSDGESPRARSRKSKGPRRGSNDTYRKSKAQQNTKAVKENLTEEQKRSNHILSEQKRRNLIREGFDDLCSLVPGLRGGGFSKSAMLTQAADWLDDTLRGNEILKGQLAELKSMNGFMIPR